MAVLKVPVSKAGATIDVDTNDIPKDMFTLVVLEGLKVLLGKSMSKITTKGLVGDDLTKARAAALAKANENLEALKAGKTKTRSASTGPKTSGVVMTEARRLAREVVKDAIRASGKKVSHVAASEITKIANQLIVDYPEYLANAAANIEARKAAPPSIDIASMVIESPKLVAEAEKRKAEAKEARTLSKTQAGKVAPRRKASQPTA